MIETILLLSGKLLWIVIGIIAVVYVPPIVCILVCRVMGWIGPKIYWYFYDDDQQLDRGREENEIPAIVVYYIHMIDQYFYRKSMNWINRMPF